MQWMQVDIHLYFITIVHAKTNGVHFMDISSAFFITCPWQETTHHTRISHCKKKKIKMSFDITTRSFINWLMHSWGFGQYCALCMCTISWLQMKMCYCNHILMQTNYVIEFSLHFTKEKWYGVMYTTNTCQTNSKHTNNIYSNTYASNTHSFSTKH